MQSGINLTLNAIESLEIVASDDLGEADVVLGDDMTLTVADVLQIDGRNVIGGANSGIIVNDDDAYDPVYSSTQTITINDFDAANFDGIDSASITLVNKAVRRRRQSWTLLAVLPALPLSRRRSFLSSTLCRVSAAPLRLI